MTKSSLTSPTKGKRNCCETCLLHSQRKKEAGWCPLSKCTMKNICIRAWIQNRTFHIFCLVVSEHTVSQQLLDAVQSYGNTSVALLGGKEKEQNQHKNFLTKGIMIQAGTLSSPTQKWVRSVRSVHTFLLPFAVRSILVQWKRICPLPHFLGFFLHICHSYTFQIIKQEEFWPTHLNLI